MPRPKSDLIKKTMNFRSGDFEKMGEMFEQGPSFAIRKLVSRFVDKHYLAPSSDSSNPDLSRELDDI